MEYKITEDNAEMFELGRRIAAENPARYPESMLHDFKRTFFEFLPDDGKLTEYYYQAIYCQQIYGTSLIEYGMYGFENRTHAQKTEYVTWFSRYLYMEFLNRRQDLHLLDNKFETYSLLKPYFRREAMTVASWEDYDDFCSFALRHKSIFVKPLNLELAEGVHRIVIDRDTDLRATFASLLEQAADLSSLDVTRTVDRRLILEEEIVQSPVMAQVNPKEMSVLRVTTILAKDKVHFFYPCFRLMCGDGEENSGEMYSLEALVDERTGVVLTDGIESRGSAEFHPVTGIRIKGFAMPEWKELKSMLEDAARRLPTLRYIGWDVAHSDRGWCIVEGNSNGELCMSQMCVGHGLKNEFENIIAFHLPFGFMLETVEQIIEKNRNEKKN